MDTTKKSMEARYLLAGDIGATNTRLALFEITDPVNSPARVENFKGQNYAGLVEILREFLAGEERKIITVCIGAAGPVIEDRIRLTNLAWTIDAAELRQAFGWEKVWLLNDLQAIANSIPVLAPNDFHTLKAGVPEPRGSIACLAPGTGLGVGYLTWAAGRYHPHASEGGHCDFAPANAVQDELIVFLRKKFPQVAVEHVCSGVGLPNVYDFLRESGRAKEPAWLAEKLAAVNDRTPVIVDEAMARKPGSEICQIVLEIFVDVLAAEAGSQALMFGCTGGVILGGGIPPRILPAFERYKFMQTFTAKTAYEPYLDRFPVKVILNAEAGLLGAAEYGVQQVLYPDPA